MVVTIAVAPILHPLMAVILVAVMAAVPTVAEMEAVIDDDHVLQRLVPSRATPFGRLTLSHESSRNIFAVSG